MSFTVTLPHIGNLFQRPQAPPQEPANPDSRRPSITIDISHSPRVSLSGSPAQSPRPNAQPLDIPPPVNAREVIHIDKEIYDDNMTELRRLRRNQHILNKFCCNKYCCCCAIIFALATFVTFTVLLILLISNSSK